MPIPTLDQLSPEYRRDYEFLVAAYYHASPYKLRVVGNRTVQFGDTFQHIEDLDWITIRQFWAVYQSREANTPGIRMVGIGHDAVFYMEVCKMTYATLEVAGIPIVMSMPAYGQTLGELVEELKGGIASVREVGCTVPYEEALWNYWTLYRPIDRMIPSGSQSGLMRIHHLSDDEVLDSKRRLEQGLIPRRRYATPAIQLGMEDRWMARLQYKAMAVILLHQVATLINDPNPLVPEGDVQIDRNGVLYIPMPSPELEVAFTALWRRVDHPWPRLSLLVSDGIPFTLDGQVYYGRIA